MDAQAQERQVIAPIESRMPGNEYRRALRVTTHAIKRMLERASDFGIRWPNAGRETAAIGSAIDLLVREARDRGATERWWEKGDGGAFAQVEVATLDLGTGRPALHAVIVPNDMDDADRVPYAILTVLYDRQFHSSIRMGRFTKEKPGDRGTEPPARLVAFGDALAGVAIVPTPTPTPANDPMAGVAAAFQSAIAACVVPPSNAPDGELRPTPPPVPDTLRSHSAHRDIKPSNPRAAEQHTAEVAAAGLVTAPGALICYQPGNPSEKRATMEVRAWADVPGVISDLVDAGVEIDTIAAFRLVPLRVRRAITITLGEE